MEEYVRGPKVAEGKTKIIYNVPGKSEFRGEPAELVILESKDDITAGDGAKRDVLLGKGALANRTTCNVFELLRNDGIPVAYRRRLDEASFLALRCEMLPYEVVVRSCAYGSYLKRNPGTPKGFKFVPFLVEFFQKTSDKKCHGRPIPVDDPLIVLRDGDSYLYRPDMPLADQKPFLVIDGYPPRYEEMADIAHRAFALLKCAWSTVGAELIDYKVEFGLSANNELLLADVIDNDSWRVVYRKDHLDKQRYRDGKSLDDVLKHYEQVSELTDTFRAAILPL